MRIALAPRPLPLDLIGDKMKTKLAVAVVIFSLTISSCGRVEGSDRASSPQLQSTESTPSELPAGPTKPPSDPDGAPCEIVDLRVLADAAEGEAGQAVDAANALAAAERSGLARGRVVVAGAFSAQQLAKSRVGLGFDTNQAPLTRYLLAAYAGGWSSADLGIRADEGVDTRPYTLLILTFELNGLAKSTMAIQSSDCYRY